MAQDHDLLMKVALDLAITASQAGEMPVGAIVVDAGIIIGQGFNRIEMEGDPTAHAEIIAIREAAARKGDWRLHNATLYVTVEPCIMCAAAVLHARVKTVVYGAPDKRWGGFGSLFDLAHDPRMNHQCEVVSGIMEKECALLCSHFFHRVRKGGSIKDQPGRKQMTENPAQ
jgi:tRNA(adenine34) deaminase